MATFDLRAYARRGAEARVAELNQELETIYRAFPELRQGRGGRAGAKLIKVEETTGLQPTRVARRRRRWKMSAAQKRAVSLRMKKYWAGRRKATK